MPARWCCWLGALTRADRWWAEALQKNGPPRPRAHEKSHLRNEEYSPPCAEASLHAPIKDRTRWRQGGVRQTIPIPFHICAIFAWQTASLKSSEAVSPSSTAIPEQVRATTPISAPGRGNTRCPSTARVAALRPPARQSEKIPATIPPPLVARLQSGVAEITPIRAQTDRITGVYSSARPFQRRGSTRRNRTTR